MKKIAWTKHKNDEVWYGGPCDSVKECVEEAKLEDYKDTEIFAIGYIETYEVNYVNADQIIDFLQQDAYEEVGEVSEDWLTNITSEQCADLESRVRKVVLEWLKDCNEEPSFYKIVPFDELTLQEALRKYDHPTEKGGAE